MKAQTLMILGLCFAVTVQAKYEFSQTAKDCIAEIKTDEDSIRAVVTEDAPVPEDNELVQQFFGCIFRNFLNDNNQLVEDEKVINYITNILTVRMKGKSKLAQLVAKDIFDHCKDIKGDTKGKAAVAVMNCLKKRFDELAKE